MINYTYQSIFQSFLHHWNENSLCSQFNVTMKKLLFTWIYIAQKALHFFSTYISAFFTMISFKSLKNILIFNLKIQQQQNANSKLYNPWTLALVFITVTVVTIIDITINLLLSNLVTFSVTFQHCLFPFIQFYNMDICIKKKN